MKYPRLVALTCGLMATSSGLVAIRAFGQSGPKPDKTDATRPPVSNPAPLKPGKDRWPVKTASDLEVGEVRPAPVKTSVEKLLAIPRPVDLPLFESNPWFQDRRVRPVETTVWTVEADVTQCQLMPDGDYRVTIRGVSGKTMVLEMPNPDPQFVDPKSPFAAKIKSARAQFDSKQQPERALKEMKGHAIITGIGFFGRAYGNKRDITDNLIQLHPVLNITWQDKPTTEFTTPTEPGKTPPTKSAKPNSTARPHQPTAGSKATK